MQRLGLALLALFAVAGAAAAVAVADTPPPTTPTGTTPAPALIAPGVVLGGVQVGGLSADAAVQAVQAWFARPVVLTIGTARTSVLPSQFKLAVPAAVAVATVSTAPAGAVFGLRASVDRSLVRKYVASLAARYDRKAVDARLLLHAQKPRVTKAIPGRQIRTTATESLVAAELVHGTRTPIAVPLTTLKPTTTVDSIGPVIVIQRGSNKLTLYDGGRYVRRFPVATGQAIYPTPLGHFQIIVKEANPWWYPPTQDAWAKGLKPVPPGPSNPLGTRWMGLDSPGVGIHGTDEPASIGYSESHGCIRMQVPDAEWLFAHVNVGTQVFILPS